MRKVASLSLVVLLVGVMAACTTVVVKDSGPEQFYPGEFIESVDAELELVKCTGEGPELQAAIDNARKGCLQWYITHRMANSPSERQAYTAQQKAVMAKVNTYVNQPPPGSAAGKGKGVKSRTRVSDDRIRVVIITDVHKKLLQDDLVAMNIIAKKDEMLDAAGRPVLTTVPFKASKGSKLRGMMEGQINAYLTKNRWEVVSAAGVEDLNKMVDAIGEIEDAEDDDAAKVAMVVGADVYVQFEAKKERGKGRAKASVAYTVHVAARETTTGRMLASEKVTSPARANWAAGEESRALDEALADAMGKLLPQIETYWREDAPNGKKFYVVFKNTPKGTDIKMNSMFKKNCSRVKLVRSTKNEAAFQVQCKMDNLELSGAIDEAISAKMGGAEYDFAAKNRSNIIVVFK
jgi:hypothetical protein